MGGVDISFNPGAGANDNVWTLATQGDGRVIIGGRFTSFNGTTRNRIARLNPDGSLDTTFNPGTGADGEIQAIRLDANGRVLIGGSFATINGTNRSGVARLNSDGSLDLSFNPGTGANATVWALAVQADGKILLGGQFTSVNGNTRNGIARLTTTGAIDDTFAPGTGVTNGIVYALAVQTNTRILIGGSFSSYAGTTRTNIARLNSNGTLDTTFNPGAGAGGTGNSVNALGLQSDGRIIVAGDFTTFDTLSRKYVARLDTNGVVDVGFVAEPNLTVRALAVQTDDRLLIGGDFDSLGGVPRSYVARLQANGGLDATFDSSSSANDTVEALGLQTDGRVVIGGWFNSVQALPRSRIARLHVAPNALSPRLIGTRQGANFSVAFGTLTNTAYLLEYSDAVAGRPWVPLAMVFGDGATKSLVDVNANVARRFYRLRTLYSEPFLLNPRRIGNTFQVQVPAFAWRTMVLEYKNSLNDAVWTGLPGVTGDNTVKTLSDSGASVATRMYRVRAQ